MTDDKGGSGTQSGAAAPPADDPTKNKTVKMTVDQALAENEALKQKIAGIEKLNGELALQLKAANDVLEGQAKAKLIGEILPRSAFTLDELTGKTVEELEQIRATLDAARLPTHKSAFLGSVIDIEDREDGLTVGDLSYSTAQRRKQGRA
jgi:hypothetical protein